MNVFALYLIVGICFFGVKKIFLKVTLFISVVTVVGLYRDLKTWCVMVLITMTTTISPNLSTNRKVCASCEGTFVVHFVKLTVDFYANM